MRVSCFFMYIKGQIEANISNEANCIQQQENQGKLKTFKKFETNLNFEEYLNEISNIKHRQAVTKLRISSHRLSVESGRYNNIPFDERTCKLCNLNEVGNEQHYLMQCSNTMF